MKTPKYSLNYSECIKLQHNKQFKNATKINNMYGSHAGLSKIGLFLNIQCLTIEMFEEVASLLCPLWTMTRRIDYIRGTQYITKSLDRTKQNMATGSFHSLLGLFTMHCEKETVAIFFELRRNNKFTSLKLEDVGLLYMDHFN